MAGEKTEKPTPKKRRDTRKEGEVLKSQEVNNSMTMFGAILALSLLWRTMLDTLLDFFAHVFKDGFVIFGTISVETVPEILAFMIKTLFIVSGPVVLLIMLSGLAVNYIQVGVLFTPKAVMPKGERISLLQGLKRLVSMKTLMNLLKSLLKVAAFLIIGYLAIEPLFQLTAGLINENLNAAIEFGAGEMISLAIKLLIAMVFVAVVDYVFQWFQFEKKLKMSKQELKDEHKNAEGSPETKSRIKRIQSELSTSRMMQAIPDADVVVTNPTHYAIALQYEKGTHGAPIVVARGAGFLAKRIKEKAKDHNIEIVEEKELAQTLYKVTRVGDQIPIELFDAVAEVLAYVYSIDKKKKV